MDRSPLARTLVVIGAAVTLAATAGCAGQREPATTEAANGCEGRARTAAELAGEAPAGWRVAGEEQALGKKIADEVPPRDLRRVTTKRVAKGREAVLMIVVEVRHPAFADGYLSGVSKQIGGEIQDVQFGETRATLHRTDDGGASMLGKSDVCAAAVLLGTSPEATKDLARELPAKEEPTP